MNNNYKLYILSPNLNKYEELDIEYSDMLTIFSIENIKDITTRKDTVTKDIQLKGTKRNNKVLGQLYNISRYSDETYNEDINHNFKANKYIKCILLENNIQILSGALVVRNITINNNNITYNCGIAGDLITFFNDIKDKNLEELDSINEIITYTLPNITKTWLPNHYVDGNYVFPTIDYGVDDRPITKDNNDNDVIPNWYDSAFDFKNYRPAIKVKSYLDAIFKGFRFDEVKGKYTQFDEDNTPLNKFSYTSSFFDQLVMKKLVVPYNDELLSKKVIGIWNSINFDSSSFDSSLGRIRFFQSSVFSGFDSKYFTAQLLDGLHPDKRNPSMVQNNISVLVPFEPQIKTRVNISFNLTLKANMQGTFYVGLVDITPLKYTGDASTSTFVDLDNMVLKQTVVKTSSIDETFNINIDKTEDITLNGKYAFAIIKEGSVGVNYSTTNISITLGRINSVTALPITQFDTFKLYEAIPKNIKILDFMKSLLTMFNLYVVPNPDNQNEYIIETYNTFYQNTISLNTDVVINWSNKIDFGNYNIKTNLNLPKAYKFNYAEDGDMMNEFYKNRYGEGYGNITLIDSQGYNETKETTLIFAPTININHSMNEKMLPILYKADSFLSGKKKPMNTKIRILYFNGYKSANEYSVHYRGNEIQKLSSYGYASMVLIDFSLPANSLFFDLPKEYFTNDDILTDGNKTLYSNYHQQQIKDLTDENLIILEAKAYLNEMDIERLNFQKPIFVQTQNGNSYFKLLEVEYANSNTTSNIKLQKIVL